MKGIHTGDRGSIDQLEILKLFHVYLEMCKNRQSTHQYGYKEENLFWTIFIYLGCWSQRCIISVISRYLHLFSHTWERHLDFLFEETNSPVKVRSLIEIPLPRNYLMLGDD